MRTKICTECGSDSKVTEKLLKACLAMLSVMEIQEKRETEEFHLHVSAFRPLWNEAKRLAREAIRRAK